MAYAAPTPPPPGLPPPAVTIDREVEILLAAGVFLVYTGFAKQKGDLYSKS
jgi:hypothetical protein